MLESTTLAALAGALALAACGVHASPAGFGMVAYRGQAHGADGGQAADGAFVVINPNRGAAGLDAAQAARYRAAIARLRAQGGRVLGYVATGYDGNTADEQARYTAIAANVAAYEKNLGGVDGWFFDEAAYDDAALTDVRKCAGTPAKWAAVRATLAAAGADGTVMWNAGWPGAGGCFVGAAQPGEHVVMYETAYAAYAAASWLDGRVQDVARAHGVKTWLLVHGAAPDQAKATHRASTSTSTTGTAATSATATATAKATATAQANANAKAADDVYVASLLHHPARPWGGPIWNDRPSYPGSESRRGTQRVCPDELAGGGPCR